MKPLLALALVLLPAATVAAAPVHVTLKAGAAVQPDADGFFALGSVAGLTGGDPALRARVAKVPVGRAPLPGDVRHLTRGDLALKLRQAGLQPGRDAVLEGATDADVTVGPETASSGPAETPSSPSPFSPRGEKGSPQAGGVSGILIHRGDPVTICISDGAMTVTAKGIAHDNGAAGETIHVRREDSVSDLSVVVLDAQTVQLEP